MAKKTKRLERAYKPRGIFAGTVDQMPKPPPILPALEDGGSYAGMIPQALHKLWGLIPSAADVAVTGQIAATPEEYDRMRALKEAEIARRQMLLRRQQSGM